MIDISICMTWMGGGIMTTAENCYEFFGESVQQQMRSRNHCNKSCRLIYRFFDFIDVSRSETSSSEYIDFLILFLHLAQKPYRASILIF